MADRKSLRLAATLLFISVVLLALAQFAHATIDGKVSNGNNHVAEFAAIAAGSNWIAIHLAQFIASAILAAGLLALYYALNTTAAGPMWLNRFAAAAVVVSLALAGVVYIVDGVALKHAADAWAQAPAAEKAASFAAAEAVRWLEWGSRSYNNVSFGIALVLFAISIVWTGSLTRPIGYSIGLSGVASIVLGWQTGAKGFAHSTGIAFYVFSLLLVIWVIWLVVIAWRMREPVPAPS